jgi:hypothetical protein
MVLGFLYFIEKGSSNGKRRNDDRRTGINRRMAKEE